MIKLIIFDLDDTILHLQVPWREVKKGLIELAKKKGIDASINERFTDIEKKLEERGLLKEGDKIRKRYEEECIKNRKVILFPKMIELVKKLRKKGYLLAVCSGNLEETVKETLRLAGIKDQFHIIIGADSLDKRKPDPEPIKEILKRTGIKPEEAIFIGNSEDDVKAGKGAGIKVKRIETLNEEHMAEIEEELIEL